MQKKKKRKKVTNYLLRIVIFVIFVIFVILSFSFISLKILTVSASESKFEPKILKQSI